MRSVLSLLVGLVFGVVVGSAGVFWGLQQVDSVTVKVNRSTACVCPEGSCPCPVVPVVVPVSVPATPVGDVGPNTGSSGEQSGE